mmetsp:Transcript_97082/g.274395  ORF Transcript_97082/g.274395 Transcript_97082/m.274395 type:complete len:285 (-) Transcript_97082:65-919(-)
MASNSHGVIPNAGISSPDPFSPVARLQPATVSTWRDDCSTAPQSGSTLAPFSCSRPLRGARTDVKVRLLSVQPIDDDGVQSHSTSGYLEADPWDGCEDIAREDLATWLTDAELRASAIGGPRVNNMDADYGASCVKSDLQVLPIDGELKGNWEKATSNEEAQPSSQTDACSVVSTTASFGEFRGTLCSSGRSSGSSPRLCGPTRPQRGCETPNRPSLTGLGSLHVHPVGKAPQPTPQQQPESKEVAPEPDARGVRKRQKARAKDGRHSHDWEDEFLARCALPSS